MDLRQKVAIVTGASRGIGKAIAIGFAKEGADVVVAARTEESQNTRLQGTILETSQEIRALGGKALPVRCDVTDEESVSNMVRKVLESFGHIDVLVNNAGAAFHYPVLETPLKRWELVLRVNLTGAFICTKAVLPAMIEQRKGSIINISSLAANVRNGGTVPTGVAYGAAKAALERFTWGLAAEVGRYNIAVNALKPHNPVDTEGMRYWISEQDRRGWVSPDRMVKCTIFLANQEARTVTGVVATDAELSAWHGL